MITSNASIGRRIFCCSLIVVITQSCGFTARSRAERKVTDYMTTRSDDYVPNGFGEFFEQTYPHEIERAIGATEHVKYSLVHSFLADGTSHTDVYFHLDQNFEVLGSLTMEQMTEITMALIAPALKEMVGSDTLSHGTK